LLRNCQIQPGRVSAKLGGWPFAGDGITIHGNCTAFCGTIRREDFLIGPPVATVAKVVDRRAAPADRRSPDEPTGRANARPMMNSATSGTTRAHQPPGVAALTRATLAFPRLSCGRRA
jgi:hypothetical protein